jgi:hypothetical protein
MGTKRPEYEGAQHVVRGVVVSVRVALRDGIASVAVRHSERLRLPGYVGPMSRNVQVTGVHRADDIISSMELGETSLLLEGMVLTM